MWQSNMTAQSKPKLTGLFPDSEAAERAYEACLKRGYEIGNVSVVVSEGTRSKILKEKDPAKAELASKEAEGGELGGPTGGRVGILLTIFAAVGAAVAIPTVGFIAGPVAVALAAAGTAGVAGGLLGAIEHWGVPHSRLEEYQAGIRRGEILVMVEPVSDEDADAIREEWTALGGRKIHYR